MKPSPKALRTIGVVILLLCGAILYLRAFYVHGSEREQRRAWNEAVKIPIADGNVSLDVLDKQFMGRDGKCPYCGRRIHILPISPSGDRIVTYGTERPALDGRFYAYCPTPDRKGKMPFQFGVTLTFLDDSEVSWFFSKRLDKLSDQELEMENAYRVRIGKGVVRRR